MTKSFLLFVIYALCVFRLTRLIVADTVTEKFRKWIQRHATTSLRNASATWIAIDKDKPWLWRKVYGLTSCSWCVSIWISIPIVIVASLHTSWFPDVCAVPALSAVAGYLSERSG